MVFLSLGLIAGLTQFLPARWLLYGVEIESDGFFYQRPLRRRKVIRYDAIERIVACAKIGPAPNFGYELKTTSGRVILHADIVLETTIVLKLMALPGFRFAELHHALIPDSVLTTKKTVMWQRAT